MPYLYSREDWGWGGATGNARWAFFGVFIVLIVIMVMGTIRANKIRSRQGVAPIYGTRWMTPPSYHHSQNASGLASPEGPDVPTSYVPAYSAHATEFDMGHYDLNGKFHVNPRARAASSLLSHLATTPIPEQAHAQFIHSTDGVAATPISQHTCEDVHNEAEADDSTRRRNHSLFFNRATTRSSTQLSPRGPQSPICNNHDGSGNLSQSMLDHTSLSDSSEVKELKSESGKSGKFVG